MQEPSVRAFKNELRNYNYYQSRVVTLSNSIEFLYERLGGVRGIDPSKEPLHSAPNKDYEWQIRDQIEMLVKKKDLFEKKIAYIDAVLECVDEPYVSAVRRIFAEGKNSYMVANDLHMSQNSLLYQINKALREVLE